MSKYIRITSLFIALLSVSACLPSAGVQRRLFVLEDTPASSAPSKSDKSLLVDVFGGYGKFIAYSESPGELAFYRTVKWGKPAPDMLESMIVSQLEGSREVSSLVGVVTAEQTLRVQIKRFEVVQRDGWQVVIAARAYLIDNASREVLKSEKFEVSEPVEDVEIEDIMKDFQKASDNFAALLASWL